MEGPGPHILGLNPAFKPPARAQLQVDCQRCGAPARRQEAPGWICATCAAYDRIVASADRGDGPAPERRLRCIPGKQLRPQRVDRAPKRLEAVDEDEPFFYPDSDTDSAEHAPQPTPTVEPGPHAAHVVVIIDASASMAARDVRLGLTHEEQASGLRVPRLEASLEAASSFMRGLGQEKAVQYRFSVVSFNETAKVHCERLDAQSAAHALDNAYVIPRCGTCFASALRAAGRLLGCPGTRRRGRGASRGGSTTASAASAGSWVLASNSVSSSDWEIPSESQPRHRGGPTFSSPGQHILFLTDGQPGDALAALTYLQQNLLVSHPGLHLHGIGFGESVQSFVHLQQLCALTGGDFTLASASRCGLQEAFTAMGTSIHTASSGMSDTSWGMVHSLETEEVDAPEDLGTPRNVAFELAECRAFTKKSAITIPVGRQLEVVFQSHRGGFADHEAYGVVTQGRGGYVMRRRAPYLRGALRLLYGLHDARLGTAEDGGRLVAKVCRYPMLDSYDVALASARCTAVAQHFARLFNRATTQVGLVNPVEVVFLPCLVYEPPAAAPGDWERVEETAEGEWEPQPAKEAAQDGQEWFVAERYLPGVFVKFNNNKGYVSPQRGADVRYGSYAEAAQAFSHFSYCHSEGECMVIDLQGVTRIDKRSKQSLLLTDPLVHSIRRSPGSEPFFGRGDLGSAGAQAFLCSHRCGPTCRALGLPPPTQEELRKLGGAAPAATPGVSTWDLLDG
mmetsp:Transcript_118559/g.272014  ORF Transcript_118559/g.272014 Transcript_118559/m.272014 type:complete len:736 (+) Transcript_118559:45-2252(+)